MTNNLIIKGEIVRAYNGRTKFTEKVANRITLHSDTLPYDELEKAFEKSGERLTPTWVKEKTGYINVNSIYDIPVKAANNRKITFAEWIENYPTTGSTVTIKVALKDGAIYPVCVVVEKDGEIVDPFEGM